MRTVSLFFLSFFYVINIGAAELDRDFERMFQERLKSVVIVEFFVETETDRRPISVNGIVVDDDGLIQLQENAIPNWIPVDQLKEFKALRPGEIKGVDAEFLGQDRVRSWYYVRVLDDDFKKSLVPVTEYPLADLKIGTSVWGIGIAPKSMDYTPFFMRSEVATIQSMPDHISFCTTDVSSPGSLAFNLDGDFAGWGMNPLNFERVLTIEGRRFNGKVSKVDETSAFLVAKGLISLFGAIPDSPLENDWVWNGMVGLGPLEDEVSELMGLEGGSAITVSEIVKKGAADKAGLENGDILISLNGETFRRYIPRYVVVSAFEREIKKLNVGDTVTLGVLRSGERLDLEMTLEPHPRLVREASRQYYEKLGLTVREFLLIDRVTLNMQDEDVRSEGIIVNYVKPNGFAQSAGLQNGDLIQEIDGQTVESYENAVAQIEELVAKDDLKDFVVLIRRGTETSVLRVNLK